VSASAGQLGRYCESAPTPSNTVNTHTYRILNWQDNGMTARIRLMQQCQLAVHALSEAAAPLTCVLYMTRHCCFIPMGTDASLNASVYRTAAVVLAYA
jgi:hypothetical protein